MKILKILLALTVIIFVYSCVDHDELLSDIDSNDNIETRQFSMTDFTNPISPCEASNLTYFVDPCFDGSGYDGGIQAGMQAINDAPLSLFWTEVDNAADADLVFDCQGIGSCGTGVASPPIDLEAIHPTIFGPGAPCGAFNPNDQTNFPSGGSIGGTIELFAGVGANCPCTAAELDVCFFMGTAMHEVVHTLGFFHNDLADDLPTAGPCADALVGIELGTHIPGTPMGVDPGSIINSGPFLDGAGLWCDRPCEFNANDLTALQTFYPEIVVGPSEFCFITSDEKATFCGIDLPPGSTISATGVGFSSEIDGDCVLISFDDPGLITINFEVCIDGCCFNVVKTIFADNQCCNTCYCECETPIEGTFPLEYETVRNKISCQETESCDELFPQGDEFFNCKRISVPTALDVTLSGDEEICIEDGYGTWCVGGLPFGTSTSWTINGPGVSDEENSSNNCLSYDLDEPGTYLISVTVCIENCCETLFHTTEVSECLDCYCECWELIEDHPWDWNSSILDGQSSSSHETITTKGKAKYRLVQLPIDCNDDCDEQYPTGDEYFDCTKIMK